MKTAVIVFPGSNCDRDMAMALRDVTGSEPVMVWHKDVTLPTGLDLIAIPGGFSFGDYLRCGAIAAQSPIMQAVAEFARRGGAVLGVCNGFQVLAETNLLPGVLMRNASLKFVCRDVYLRVETTNSPYLGHYTSKQVVKYPIAHMDGNYIANEDVLDMLDAEDRVAFRYVDENGIDTAEANPNGAMRNIAGVLSENRRVLGMMPHPERLIDDQLGGSDGRGMFKSISEMLMSA